mgnify:CR=1 FL=1
MWDGHEGMGWWMLIGSLWFVLFWGLIIWAVVTFVSRLDGSRSNRSTREESPIDIAKRRYARGEISKEEYDRLRTDLS